jgi:hypothetical protein
MELIHTVMPCNNNDNAIWLGCNKMIRYDILGDAWSITACHKIGLPISLYPFTNPTNT